ncbi:fimbrial protein [Achromobacter sp. NFACC18-2]|uniref:fimbrial protein n=1 Tax=Achromobacter sp. NFACC18-2 TaxID=1564112 RepID=UPI0008B6B1AE|nr:fimbrial protein [Achromobacter sp. NFACC18-2]SEJ28101.1 major type 1 subunit fimbrin (pilin) [Achromobacter sp. NFACC18-2]
MKKLVINALIASAFAAFAGAASADTGNISFQGEITTSPCSIGGGQQGADMVVSMGSISTNYFANVGDRGPASAFSISLLNCDVTTLGTASIAFRPGAGSVVLGRLLGLENGAGAQGVAIALEDVASNTDVVVGGAAKTYTLAEGTNVFNFKAYYEATETSVTAGPANARAVFEVTYS